MHDGNVTGPRVVVETLPAMAQLAVVTTLVEGVGGGVSMNEVRRARANVPLNIFAGIVARVRARTRDSLPRRIGDEVTVA
jgi:hypothetical protein